MSGHGPGRPATSDQLRPGRRRRAELRRHAVVCQLCEQPSSDPVCRRCSVVLQDEADR